VANTQASGWSGRYTYQSPLGAFVLGQREFGRGFRSFANAVGIPFPRSESRIGVATTMGRFNLSADLVRTVTDSDARDTAFLRASTNLARTVSVFAELQTTRIDERKGWALNVYLRADLDRERWNAATYTSGTSGRSLDLETGKQLPEGIGVGYRAGTSTTWQGSRTRIAGFGGADWNLRPFSVGLFASTPVHGDGSSFLHADLAGALVGLGGYWGFTRQVTDSFALARLGVPQAGVEIFLNNQTQGRTDDEGRVLIPQISSYGRQSVTLNEADLGIQYSLPRQSITLAPAFRSGNVVDFGIGRVRAIAGRAWLLQGGQRTPVASRAWAMAGPAGRMAIETGAGGDFYAEDVAPGHYTGTLQVRERAYACRLDVPDFPEPVHELKEGVLCD
jgi:outer membrane usher protein